MMFRYLILALITLSPACLLAAGDETQRYYDVELVIFENLDTAGQASENWPSDAVLPTPALVAHLDDPATATELPQYLPDATFRLLPASAYQLNSQAKLLESAGSYRVLLHTAWRQPGLPIETARSVQIDDYILPPNTTPPPTTDNTTPPVSGDQVAGTQATEVDGQLQTSLPENYVGQYASLKGYVTVVLSRYLHLQVDLAYRKDLSANPVNLFDMQYLDTNKPQAKPTVYFFHDKRRMRSKELHYLDHPVIGILALITPYEPPATPKPTSVTPAMPSTPVQNSGQINRR